MNRSVFSLLLLSLLLLTGCPDTRSSRHPQSVAELAALRAEIDGLKARVNSLEKAESTEVKRLEDRIRDLEREEDKPQPVVIQQHFHGGATPARSGDDKVGTVIKKNGTAPRPIKKNGKQPKKVVKQPVKKNGGQASLHKKPKNAPRQMTQRKGYDAWNDLRPAKKGETPRVGGKIRVHFSAEPKNLNTYLDNSAVTSYITAYIYEGLIDQDPITFKWKPWLAKSWDTEDMLFEVTGAEPIEGVAFVAGRQKWVKKEGKDEQLWWPWQIRKTAAGGHELLKLKEHIGSAKKTVGGWILSDKSGNQIGNFALDKVARVNEGTVFTFHLRRGVKFHDGKEMTADDVVFSLAFCKSKFVDAPSIRSYYQNLRPAKKIDDYTVQMIYENQYFKALDFAGGIVIHPKHVFDPDNLIQNDEKSFGEKFNKHPNHRKPVGTGAYKFASWDAGKSLTLKRVGADYWNQSKAGYLDEITYVFIPEPQTALASLRAGDLDFMPRMRSEQFFKETDTQDFKSRFVKPIFYIGNFGYIGWNMRNPPFNDVKVRRALAYGSFDVQKDYIKNLLYGAGVRVGGPQYIYGSMYDQKAKLLPFDLEKARKLLRESGWFDRDGDGVIENADRVAFKFEMLMPQGSATNRQLMAIMAENLKKLGIKMEVRELEWAVFIENLNDRKFDACRLGWVQPVESDPFQIWHSSNSENRGSNHVGFVNKEADQLILKIRETLDVKERRGYHHRLQKLIYDAQPYNFLACAPNLGAYDPRFHGVRFIPFRPGYDLKEWYLASEE